MLFGEVNSVFSIFDRIAGIWKKQKIKSVISVSHRFVELFEAHGVNRNQIPRFFGHDITLGDLTDDTLLLAKLTEPVLDAACSLFSVRREWLDGTEEEAYAHHDFYKSPQNFEQFISRIKSANPEVDLGGYLIVPDSTAKNDPAVLILEEAIDAVGDTVIYRYHLCDDWVFSYWKSRAYLTACVAIAWKKQVFIKGRYGSQRELLSLTSKQTLPGAILNCLTSGRRWYAEDLALQPEDYLREINPEQDSFGLISALRQWLHLDDDGWMETGLQKEVRSAFEAELAKYQPIDPA